MDSYSFHCTSNSQTSWSNPYSQTQPYYDQQVGHVLNESLEGYKDYQMDTNPYQPYSGMDSQVPEHSFQEGNVYDQPEYNPWEYGGISTYPTPDFYQNDQGDHSQHYGRDEKYWEIQRGLLELQECHEKWQMERAHTATLLENSKI